LKQLYIKQATIEAEKEFLMSQQMISSEEREGGGKVQGGK